LDFLIWQSEAPVYIYVKDSSLSFSYEQRAVRECSGTPQGTFFLLKVPRLVT
jgi:hypothetical protein